MSSSRPERSTTLETLFAQTGLTGAFSSKVADYAASRPDYPPALIDALERIDALFPGARVADIAAGTGLFTQSLLERGYPVVAIEPNAPMRKVAATRLAHFRTVECIEGTAEASTLESATVDLVTVAQAFHWFDVDASRREFLRILKPKGQVALIWNTRPLDDPLQNAIDGTLSMFGGAKHVELAQQQDLSNVPRFFGGAQFQELGFHHSQHLARAGLLSLVLSRSSMPDRGTPEGARAERELSGLFDQFAQDGEVIVEYRTVAMVGRPIP